MRSYLLERLQHLIGDCLDDGFQLRSGRLLRAVSLCAPLEVTGECGRRIERGGWLVVDQGEPPAEG